MPAFTLTHPQVWRGPAGNRMLPSVSSSHRLPRTPDLAPKPDKPHSQAGSAQSQGWVSRRWRWGTLSPIS